MAIRASRKRPAASEPLDSEPNHNALVHAIGRALDQARQVPERQVPERRVRDRPERPSAREPVARPDADSTSVVDAVNAEERAFMEHERARRLRRRSIEFFTYPDGSTTTKVTYGEPS